ncbi:hypothetical protein FRC12_003048 [Ceratobasidium sp. 428]|nr:hypothetical protein FRC12_003048 [Ceratobasidium sp. 428]
MYRHHEQRRTGAFFSNGFIATTTTSSAAPTSTFTCTKTYSVKSGDDCQAIATSNSILYYQLTYLNPSMNCNALSTGQSLCLTTPQYNCQPSAPSSRAIPAAQSPLLTASQ